MVTAKRRSDASEGEPPAVEGGEIFDRLAEQFRPGVDDFLEREMTDKLAADFALDGGLRSSIEAYLSQKFGTDGSEGGNTDDVTVADLVEQMISDAHFLPTVAKAFLRPKIAARMAHPDAGAWARLAKLLEDAMQDPTIAASTAVEDFVFTLVQLAAEAPFTGGTAGINRRINKATAERAGASLRVSGEDNRERVAEAWNADKGPERGRRARIAAALDIPDSTVGRCIATLKRTNRIA